jgi:hypothetical protein
MKVSLLLLLLLLLLPVVVVVVVVVFIVILIHNFVLYFVYLLVLAWYTLLYTDKRSNNESLFSYFLYIIWAYFLISLDRNL